MSANIDIETCERCDAAVTVIASIEDVAVITTIHAHLEKSKWILCSSAGERSPPASIAADPALRSV
ncbi:MAG: hypothetical protein ACT4NU_07295 [Chromatiales bacterium]